MSIKTMFTLGMATCLVAALLMLVDVVDIGWGAATGMVGVGAIAAAGANHRAIDGEQRGGV